MYSDKVFPAGTLILAAHPDDETVGAGASLAHVPGCHVAHLTRGVPEARHLWPEVISGTPESYAETRRAESEAALSLAHVGASRIHCLGGEDQRAIDAAPVLIRRLLSLLLRARPPLLITHAYEGGHPDHDTACLVARVATHVLRRAGIGAPEVVEMTSYHAESGALVTGAFIARNDVFELEHVLDPPSRDRKRKMIAAYRSQAAVLSMFSVERERFRSGPGYRFDLPPHSNQLWYERQGWAEGKHWRAQAKAALAVHDLPESTCL